MKSFIILAFLVSASVANTSEIILSSKIDKGFKAKIERDLSILDKMNFQPSNPKTLQVLGLSHLDTASVSNWLYERVKYIIEEDALNSKKLIARSPLYVEEKNASYPNTSPNYNPHTDLGNEPLIIEKKDPPIVMKNLGSGIYIIGKSDSTLYGLKIPNGKFKKAIKVKIDSPRAGVIQIGEMLFKRVLSINNEDENAYSNSINRIGSFFHEARHSDGNGPSLGFSHSICPKDHEYAGHPACDEHLNGSYAVGALMQVEMIKSCEDNCSEREKETLKLVAIDNFQRVMLVKKDGSETTDWDSRPESL